MIRYFLHARRWGDLEERQIETRDYTARTVLGILWASMSGLGGVRWYRWSRFSYAILGGFGESLSGEDLHSRLMAGRGCYDLFTNGKNVRLWDIKKFELGTSGTVLQNKHCSTRSKFEISELVFNFNVFHNFCLSKFDLNWTRYIFSILIKPSTGWIRSASKLIGVISPQSAHGHRGVNFSRRSTLWGYSAINLTASTCL